MSDIASEFMPAFISGALFILVVAGGVIWMVKIQLPGWSPAERAAAGRGFVVSAVVALLTGAGLTVVSYAFAPRYGAWCYAVPASVIVSGVAFLVAGRWFGSARS